MSKPKAKSTNPEWNAADLAFVLELDIRSQERRLIEPYLGPGLIRVFMQWWIDQDAKDPEILFDPFDEGDDPVWWQIDGMPSNGGTPKEVLGRKWARRAALYFDFFGPHVWHVVDWLIVARQRNQSWLHNLNERGEPKKLLKCRTIFDLAREADKGLSHRQAAKDVPLGPDDEVILFDLGVGHTLVQLKTPRALQREGSSMHHCVGHGSYDGRLNEEGYRLLSVRDPDGRPLATLEIVGDTVRQFRGPYNADPVGHVIDLVSRAADEFGWKGLMEAADGRYSPYGREALAVLEELPPVRRRI